MKLRRKLREKFSSPYGKGFNGPRSLPKKSDNPPDSFFHQPYRSSYPGFPEVWNFSPHSIKIWVGLDSGFYWGSDLDRNQYFDLNAPSPEMSPDRVPPDPDVPIPIPRNTQWAFEDDILPDSVRIFLVGGSNDGEFKVIPLNYWLHNHRIAVFEKLSPSRQLRDFPQNEIYYFQIFSLGQKVARIAFCSELSLAEQQELKPSIRSYLLSLLEEGAPHETPVKA